MLTNNVGSTVGYPVITMFKAPHFSIHVIKSRFFIIIHVSVIMIFGETIRTQGYLLIELLLINSVVLS